MEITTDEQEMMDLLDKKKVIYGKTRQIPDHTQEDLRQTHLLKRLVYKDLVTFSIITLKTGAHFMFISRKHHQSEF